MISHTYAHEIIDLVDVTRLPPHALHKDVLTNLFVGVHNVAVLRLARWRRLLGLAADKYIHSRKVLAREHGAYS
jgi:hypothetical protein